MNRLLSRPVVILAILVGVGLVVAAAGRPWVWQAVTGVPGAARATVSGSRALPAATAVALVAAAGAVALALTGRVTRRIVAGLLVLAGLGMAALVVTVLQDPAQAVLPAVQTATGQVGPVPGGTSGLGTPRLTGWPWLALGGGLLVVVGGLAGLVAGTSWAGAGRRFEGHAVPSRGQVAQARARRERGLDDWDALSRGEDPTVR